MYDDYKRMDAETQAAVAAIQNVSDGGAQGVPQTIASTVCSIKKIDERS